MKKHNNLPRGASCFFHKISCMGARCFLNNNPARGHDFPCSTQIGDDEKQRSVVVHSVGMLQIVTCTYILGRVH
jgi:hypothetical protein